MNSKLEMMVAEMKARSPRDADEWINSFVAVADRFPACIVITDMTIAGGPMVFVNRGLHLIYGVASNEFHHHLSITICVYFYHQNALSFSRHYLSHLISFPLPCLTVEFSRQTGYSFNEAVGRNCRFLQGPESELESIQAIRFDVIIFIC